MQKDNKEEIKKIDLEEVEEIGKENQKAYKKLKEITKKIEDKEKQILKLSFTDEEINLLLDNKEVVLNTQYQIKNEQDLEKFTRTFNNKFLSDNFFLILDSLISNKEKNGKGENLENANKFIDEKGKLINEFDKLYDQITTNNRKIASLERKYIENTATITTENIETLRTFSKGIIDDLELFKLNDITRIQLKMIIKANEDKTINIHIKKDTNYSNTYLNFDFNLLQNPQNALIPYQPTPINKYNVFNDKVSKSLIDLANNEKVTIEGTGGKGLKNADIKAVLKNAEITESKVLTQWDKVILQAIYSVSKENKYFSLNMIKKELAITRRHKTKIDDDILKSINKMMITRITLDIAKELNEKYKNPLSEKTIEALGVESYLLPLEKTFLKVGGVKQEMYYFIKPPIYFAYIDARNQIITLPTEKMQIYALAETKENVLLKTYLFARIKDMQHQKKTKGKYIDTILYDTIFKENDLLQEKEKMQIKNTYNEYNKKRNSYRKTIKEILENYKNEKEIKAYKEVKENRTYTKIQIFL